MNRVRQFPRRSRKPTRGPALARVGYTSLRKHAQIALAAWLFVLAVPIGPASAWTLFEESPEERAARLSPAWQLSMPGGAGPHPGAILLSGCDGVRDNMGFWAAEFLRHGRAALVLDSHSPRGLDRLESWRLVCAALAMPGAERAGDVAVALHAMSRMDGISDDVVLFGASHGGWAAMEFVGAAASGNVPPGLTRWPEPPGDLLSRLSALVLLYPYCGYFNDVDGAQWRGAPPTLMILAENDSIISTPSCLDLAAELRQGGAIVETVVIGGADHGFDQREKSVLSTLPFNAGQRDTAREAIEDFLDRYAR